MAQKIAIVEDEPSINQLYEIKFTTEGYVVQTAHNGKEGLELVKSMQPDVVLLDLLMPEMNGDEMLRLMRESDWGKDIKVIILTNVSKEEAPDAIRELNVQKYIVKAEMTTDQVVQVVRAVLAEPMTSPAPSTNS